MSDVYTYRSSDYTFEEFKAYLYACGEITQNMKVASARIIHRDASKPEKGMRYFSVRVNPIRKNKDIPETASTIKVKPAAIKAWKLANVG